MLEMLNSYNIIFSPWKLQNEVIKGSSQNQRQNQKQMKWKNYMSNIHNLNTQSFWIQDINVQFQRSERPVGKFFYQVFVSC